MTRREKATWIVVSPILAMVGFVLGAVVYPELVQWALGCVVLGAVLP